ncbi:hypothetical protein FLAG1_02262 [Fusarium langsethiae]|uniref:Uncharacterized protein n=1 Tax=Fusarium langsethiae TaxID=179993 RepID=A0A0N0DH07_FUSLA|nr:hypothetical protein FLAG1_02262 [Fusarium langsethiae]GKU00731.1 unnamed protein product [Fusarium langsethiae]GKU11513.1 unnamed protein product [Fusarium langsethiae]
MAEPQDNSKAGYTGPSYPNRRTKNFMKAIRAYRKALDEAEENPHPGARQLMASGGPPNLATCRRNLDKRVQALSLHDAISLENSDVIVKNTLWYRFLRQKEAAKEIKLKPRESRHIKETLDRFFESQQPSKIIPTTKAKTQIETGDDQDETSGHLEITSEDTEKQSNGTLQDAPSAMEDAQSKTPRNNFQPWKDNLRIRHPDKSAPVEARLLENAIMDQIFVLYAHRAVSETEGIMAEEVVANLLPDKQVGNGRKWRLSIDTDGEIPIFDPIIVPVAGIKETRGLYLVAVCQDFVFSFTSIGSLDAFTSTIAPSCWCILDNPRPSIAIELNIFHLNGFKRGQKLSAFARTSLPHGWKQGATLEFKDWMKALEELQQLPVDLRVKLCWWFPYRDFLSLRNGTRLLRKAENINFVEINIKENSWAHVP